jgi:glycosyltransferase involved in cell wall biosynthesis
MSLTVLQVAYPLAPVGRDAAGGAEQVLTWLDRAVIDAGHRSIVLACEGSVVAGILQTVRGPGTRSLDDAVRRAAQEDQRRAIVDVLRRWSVDLIHMHGVDFYTYLPEPGIPVLATLHLPPEWYPREAFFLQRPETYLNCVSRTQQRHCPPTAPLLAPIENGVPTELLAARHGKRSFALTLGRICPEKGFHLALEAAQRAGIGLIIAGEVFRYHAHERYFAEEIAPFLGPKRRFVGRVGFQRKRRLLSAATCLVVPSVVRETSSLVAMEALACGTPIIAFPSGALAEIVEHGKTGFLVHDVDEMAAAIREAHRLDPEACRHAARTHFSLERMTSQYLECYRQLVRGSTAGARLKVASTLAIGSTSTCGEPRRGSDSVLAESASKTIRRGDGAVIGSLAQLCAKLHRNL